MLRRSILAVFSTLALGAGGCVPLPPLGEQHDSAAMQALQTTARDRTAVHAALGAPDAQFRDGRLEAFHRTGDAGSMVWFPMILPVPLPAVERLGAADHVLFVAYDDAGLIEGTVLWSKVEKERRLPQVQATGSLAALAHEPPTQPLDPVVFWGEPEPPLALFSDRREVFRRTQRQRPWATPVLSPDGRITALRGEEKLPERGPDRRLIVLRDTRTGVGIGRLPDQSAICGALPDGTSSRSGHYRINWHGHRAEVLVDDETLLALTTAPALCRLTLPSGALEELPLPVVTDARDLRLVRLDDEHVAVGMPEGAVLVLDAATGDLRRQGAAVPGMLDCTAPVQLRATGHLLQSCVTEPSGELAAIAAVRQGPSRRGYATVSPEARRVLVVREPTTLAPREIWWGPAPGHLPFLPHGFDLRSTGAIAVDPAQPRLALLHGPFVELFAVTTTTDGTPGLDPLPLLPLSSAHGAMTTTHYYSFHGYSTDLPGAHYAESRDAEGRTLAGLLPMPQVLQFSADGSRLAAGFVGCVVWDTASWREVWRCDLEDETRQNELRRGFALTADGRHIVTDDGLYRLP